MTDSRSSVGTRAHPGAGRKSAAKTPKGRQVDPSAVAEIQSLLGNRPRRPDLLIEYLHLIQDQYGHLAARHVAALADLMRLAQVEVYEVASFYAHFDLVGDVEAPPPPLTIRVCDGISCEMAGARTLLLRLNAQVGPEVRVMRAPCMGRCDGAPAVAVGHSHLPDATPASVLDAIRAGGTADPLPDFIDYDAYVANDGYRLLRACLSGQRAAEDIISALDQSQLRGLGGAGFPTGRKWRIVRGYETPRLMAVNCDEGEPGTFKDRWYLERDPHRFIEGMLIGAWAIEAEACYLYVRDEYPAIRKVLEEEFDRLEADGLLPQLELEIRRGASAYICGEESAMIESIEGKRGLPRQRPPYVAEVGLFGRPTLVNNVETLYWVRDILDRGPDWFAGAGRNGR
ncbi:MAG: NAD(P)H-dependent oxidoreductase subunit E, partial [Chromatiaceae bacterium]|nr:NAD(P)H-dependent oxidoreductase subunit E [Chromatiaceae bacterium]